MSDLSRGGAVDHAPLFVEVAGTLSDDLVSADIYGMDIRRLLPALLALCAVSIASADTVMVHIRVTEESVFYYHAGIEYARAIEDGIMDVFFDAGHIVFNFGIPPVMPSDPPFDSERPAIRAAKAGGASHLIEIELDRPVVDRLIPMRIDYVYTDIIAKQILAEGSIRYQDIENNELHDQIELCKSFGQNVAWSALNE